MRVQVPITSEAKQKFVTFTRLIKNDVVRLIGDSGE